MNHEFLRNDRVMTELGPGFVQYPKVEGKEIVGYSVVLDKDFVRSLYQPHVPCRGMEMLSRMILGGISRE